MVHDQAPLMVGGGVPTDLAHQYLKAVFGTRRGGLAKPGFSSSRRPNATVGFG